MANFEILSRENVSAANQDLFDKLNAKVGFVPNLYTTFAYSENALGNYLAFSGGKTSLKAKEKEVVSLAVSEANDCSYCLAAHTAVGKMNGFTEEQILELRAGRASFDEKLNALANFAKELTVNRGKPAPATVDAMLNAGYSRENIVDVIVQVGDKTIMNYLHGVTDIAVDFPEAVKL